jgi:hypothetical protein
LPFALKIRDVTPIIEANKVKQLSLSNIQKEPIIKNTEQHHKTISNLEK